MIAHRKEVMRRWSLGWALGGWLCLTLAVPAALADDETADPSAERGATASSADPAALIRARLNAVRPGLEIYAVEPSPMPGMYAVDVAGGVLYVSEDARFLLPGKLYGLTDTDLVDLDSERLAARRKALIDAVPLEDMIVFAPADGPTKAVINVFTDVDCGFCRKLHQEMPELNARGIEVRYLAYPRAGIGSPSYEKIVTAWCSDDRQAALTALKSGANLP
ncbi:MAG: DsbC family protein, partial [Alphaproteobacteria bacterium]